MRWIWIFFSLFALTLVVLFVRLIILGVPVGDFLFSLIPGWHTTIYPVDIYLFVGTLMIFSLVLILATMNVFGNDPNKSMRDAFIWWEIRRPIYNFMMLISGILSLFISYVSIPLVYIMIAIWLNIFYSFGWLIETGVKRISVSKRLSFYLFLSYYCLSAFYVFIFPMNMDSIKLFESLMPIGFVIIPSVFFIGVILFTAKKLKITK